MDTTIRPASRDDLRELAELVANFKREHSRMIGGSKEINPQNLVEEVEERLDKRKQGYFVATNPSTEGATGNLLGFRRWKCEEDFYFSKALYVEPDARRSGVAKALIQHFEDWLLEKGQEVACISCTPHNIAMIKLARSEGYDILNTIELRKHLTDNPPEHRDEKRALGLNWKVL